MVVGGHTRDIIPPQLAVAAMRDNGYKNAAYALAELIDNSVQAKASKVEILCTELEHFRGQRVRRQVHQIAVLDNGCGMTADVLQIALQFGNGTYLHDRSGIGRFGMGLPSASISQCVRVDVWTWREGKASALHSYIDVGEIESGRQKEVPEPEPAPIPEKWLQAGKDWGPSGTLVVWSNLDRCVWRTANTIFRNSEYLVGRMYREFLCQGRVNIRLASFLDDNPQTAIEDRPVVLNDPMYLMAPSSCPAPYDQQPMFTPWGENPEKTVRVTLEDAVHDVVIRFSYAKQEARSGYDAAGSTPHGRHAGNNVGVSIMRAGRELELSQAWTIAYDPRERWWGVEVEFPPALDEVFGVSNNKQSARNFTEVAECDTNSLLSDGESLSEALERMREDGDPTAYLLEVSNDIETFLKTIRPWIAAQTAGTRRSRLRYTPDSAEVHATQVTEGRIAEGHIAAADKDWEAPAEDRIQAVESELQTELGISKEDARRTAENLILGEPAARYSFTKSSVDTPAFFTVKPSGGVYLINLNLDHPAYTYLLQVLEDVPENASADELRRQLGAAADGLKLLLIAWARYESEQPAGTPLREAAQEVRTDWGRVARAYLKKDG